MELKNRSELVFLYDIKDANPNGDPDENKPRMDEETEINIVTDVRLKRTIRDYLHNFRTRNIWVMAEFEEGGRERKTREKKLDEFWENFKIEERKEGSVKLLEQYIDLRLFGATIAGKKEKKKGEKVFTWTGPVQFKFGRSLHKVEAISVKGTSVLPTEERKAGGAFTEVWVLPYSLICFYGIINENAAASTEMSEEDSDELLDGMWNGTKNLITRSKIGQVPRFLLRAIYNESSYHIGDLDKKIKLLDEDNKEVDKDGRKGKTLRGIDEVKVDLTYLIKTLKEKKDKIREVQFEASSDVVFRINDSESKGKEGLVTLLQEIPELKDKIKVLELDK